MSLSGTGVVNCYIGKIDSSGSWSWLHKLSLTSLYGDNLQCTGDGFFDEANNNMFTWGVTIGAGVVTYSGDSNFTLNTTATWTMLLMRLNAMDGSVITYKNYGPTGGQMAVTTIIRRGNALYTVGRYFGTNYTISSSIKFKTPKGSGDAFVLVVGVSRHLACCLRRRSVDHRSNKHQFAFLQLDYDTFNATGPFVTLGGAGYDDLSAAQFNPVTGNLVVGGSIQSTNFSITSTSNSTLYQVTPVQGNGAAVIMNFDPDTLELLKFKNVVTSPNNEFIRSLAIKNTTGEVFGVGTGRPTVQDCRVNFTTTTSTWNGFAVRYQADLSY